MQLEDKFEIEKKTLRLEIGRRIKQARIDKNLSGAELSRITGLSPARVSNWERGYRQPNIEAAKTLSSCLDVSPNWLLCIDASLTSNMDPKLTNINYQRVPIYDWNDKKPFINIEPVDYFPICNSLSKNIESIESIFAMYVMDNSMCPLHKKGELLFISKSNDLIDDTFMIVQIKSSKELLFRKVDRCDDRFILTAPNTEWPAILIHKREHFDVLGHLVGILSISV